MKTENLTPKWQTLEKLGGNLKKTVKPGKLGNTEHSKTWRKSGKLRENENSGTFFLAKSKRPTVIGIQLKVQPVFTCLLLAFSPADHTTML